MAVSSGKAGSGTAMLGHAGPAEPIGRLADPCVVVIFGASGDLTKRKLLPALSHLRGAGLLTDRFAVVGIARSPLTSEQFRERLNAEVADVATSPVEGEHWGWLMERLYYLSGNANDPDTFRRLVELLSELDRRHETPGNYFFYLSTSPNLFGEIARQLGAAGLADESVGRWRRVIFEKPFGQDLASAKELNREISQVLREDQIYRIDHYLGKETVQNIMAFRFANGIYEPLWNRDHVDHVQVTVAEHVGVEQRGGYYDGAGALRDMVPNHIFQLITLTAMEPPVSFEADAVRDEQVKILHALEHWSADDVASHAVRGQYGPGEIDDAPVAGYRQEANVAANSTTETYVALKLGIDNWRWAGVPFYVRTGKRLPRRDTEIVVQFKRPPLLLFKNTPVDRLPTNRLTLHLQPDEGISLSFGAKVPGPIMRLGAVEMQFHYEDYFGTVPSTGYERLMYDCMIGDATLFQRVDMVEASWGVVAPVLEVWQAAPFGEFPNYAAGSWGPLDADELLHRDGRRWIATS
jgi:glucose-6-phosphate 1-dehydrogenase